MEMMRLARTEYEVLIARRRLSMALSSRYHTERVMEPGDHAKIYRFRMRLLEGPYALKDIDITWKMAVLDDDVLQHVNRALEERAAEEEIERVVVKRRQQDGPVKPSEL
ncbi:hypothetical protein FVE85_8742 [Porphyridium purpureum]|uniref:Uncharacterized protein n=1 Tax=Porphyridium purpureum TaxID=35688 RepID=A0A5J4YS86_PORPP|nr:hypothetical protein FVE85_8742 [Porphyridium purpureum]|eukprot:POR6339..scf296_7